MVKLSHRILMAVAALGMLGSVGATTAFAAPPTPTPGPPGQSSAGLRPAVSPGQSQTMGPASSATLWGNPWGCRDRADNPHTSTHGPADINSQGWVICNTTVGIQTAQVQSWLYRQDCILFFCSWTNVGFAQTTYPQTSFQWGPVAGTSSINANATYNCNGSSTQTFYLYVYGTAMNYAGNIYSEGLSSNNVNLACG